MKKLLLVVLIVLLFVSCMEIEKPVAGAKPVETVTYTWNDIYTADTIEIREAMLSIGKLYNIYIENSKVGEVRGEVIKLFGDTFTLYDNDGNIILAEVQQKRSFRFSLDRLAIVEREDGSTHGFIGEEKFNDLFSPWTKFHFYDANDHELGYNKAKIAVMKTAEYYDMNDNVEYRMEKVFLSLTDTYTLKVIDNNDIPIEYAIFMVCIQDAIGDSTED